MSERNEEHQKKPMKPWIIDKFQIMKQKRMEYLLEELEQKGQMKVEDFLGNIAVHYGIRRATGLEYIQDWVNAGCANVEGDVIRFLKKPEKWG